MIFTYLDSPLGPLLIAGRDGELTFIGLPQGRSAGRPAPTWQRDDGAWREARRQLTAYFAGTLTVFDLPLRPGGTPFQQQVWQALREIPYGETRSYGRLAAAIGRPAAVRAVGRANGSNPLPIVIPCHRVIGSDGTLTGYGGGLAAKQWLLELERRGRASSSAARPPGS
jgi:methylated-DNA-[protein]-cysteine S-methyltransferase